MSTSHSETKQPEVGHLVNPRILVLTAAALLMLTALTVIVREIDLDDMNIYVALTIAVIKSSLVAAFFMHLRWDRPFNVLLFVGCIIFVVLMMTFCILDTSQYRASQYRGNPVAVQETLDRDAPNAPVAEHRAIGAE